VSNVFFGSYKLVLILLPMMGSKAFPFKWWLSHHHFLLFPTPLPPSIAIYVDFIITFIPSIDHSCHCIIQWLYVYNEQWIVASYNFLCLLLRSKMLQPNCRLIFSFMPLVWLQLLNLKVQPPRLGYTLNSYLVRSPTICLKLLYVSIVIFLWPCLKFVQPCRFENLYLLVCWLFWVPLCIDMSSKMVL